MPFSSDAERWSAVLRRDRRADGIFYYSVTTTGVYGRPSCPARVARRENVRFFSSRQDAENAGFRPCRRCRPGESSPHDQYAAAIAKACRLVREAERVPNLYELADAAGFSRFHFHRVFKALTGVTPNAYVVAQRAERLREELANADTVTEAIYRAGFNSNGHFYAVSSEILGMSPTAFRCGGSGVSIRFAVADCSVGAVLAAVADKGVCAVLSGERGAELVAELERRFPNAHLVGGDGGLLALITTAVADVDLPALGLALPDAVRAESFRQRLWHRLSEVVSAPAQLAAG